MVERQPRYLAKVEERVRLPLGALEATPPTPADPSRSCGTAASSPPCHGGGHGFKSRQERSTIGDVAQSGRGSGFRSRRVWVQLPPSPLAGGQALSGVS